VDGLLAVAAAARRAGTNRVIVRCGAVDVPGAGARWEDWSRRTALAGVTDDVREEAAALLAEREVRRDAHLDAACRALHRLVRSEPEIDWWILPAAAPHALPLPDEIEHLLAEIPADRPAWVHDVASASVLSNLGVAPADAALRAADRRLAAIRVSDAFGLETGLPPGSGAVDWATVRDASAAGLPRILHVTRPCSAEELGEAAGFLGRLGP
jgi:hypothetical protein